MREKYFKKFIVMLLAVLFVINSISGSNVFAARKNDKTAPSAPTNLRAVAVNDTSVSLEWIASTDNVKVNSYQVYRDNALIGSTSTTTYMISGLLPHQTYQFYVKAKDTSSNVSLPSNTLTVTTTGATPTPDPTPTPTPEPTPMPIPVKQVVGYYAAWAAYSGFTPDKIDVSKLTHINYAFANIGSDLKITLGYPDIDPANIKKLNDLKQLNPNLKTIIAVGGWSWSGRFSDVALTDASRTAFADSCVNFIVQYGFDGIDIDWEYPVNGGLSTNIRRPEDKTNFTLLMQKLREKLDARGAMDGKKYLLSFAGAAGSWYVNNVELSKLEQHVDFANVMTYDIHGSWDTYTDFNAPLYKSSAPSPQYKWSVDDSINTWINAGFPANKLVMGVPFYGYLYKQVANVNNGLLQTYSGSQSISYANIVGNYLNAPGFVRYFHKESMVPWLFNGSTFISYEDEESMGYKAQYINTKGLAGAMIWELSQDPNRVLLNALYNGLN
jgi:chitinase